MESPHSKSLSGNDSKGSTIVDSPTVQQSQSNGQDVGNDEPANISGESTPSEGLLRDYTQGDVQTRTAYYNRASEKSLSHVEAKLIYQRHRLEISHQETETQSPVSRARTFSSNVESDLNELSRTTSKASQRSTRRYTMHDQDWKPGGPTGPAHTESQAASTYSPDLNGFNPYGRQFDGQMHEEILDTEDSMEDIGGAGAGFELGAGRTRNAIDGSDITPELSAISVNIRKVLDIREKYIRSSLQRPNDNPKDSPDWTIYPPPPQPVWDDVKNRPISLTSGANSMSSSKFLLPQEDQPHSPVQLSARAVTGDSAQQLPLSPATKSRKPGCDIGEDFEMSDLLPLPDAEVTMTYKLDKNSIYQVYKTSRTADAGEPILQVPTLREFYMDLDAVLDVSSDGPTKSFAYRELNILEGRFNLHFLENGYQETADSKKAPHRDFYNVRKVDTHVHHSACMNQKHLLRFIKSKMRKSPDEVVMFRDGRHLTLKEVFESINLTAYDLSIDTLDMHVCVSAIDGLIGRNLC